MNNVSSEMENKSLSINDAFFSLKINKSTCHSDIIYSNITTLNMLLIDQIDQNFEEHTYTLGVFVDLSKAFNTVLSKILLRAIQTYRWNYTKLV